MDKKERNELGKLKRGVISFAQGFNGFLYIGSLCRRLHKYGGKERSLRRVSNGICRECEKIHQRVGSKNYISRLLRTYLNRPDRFDAHERMLHVDKAYVEETVGVPSLIDEIKKANR